MQTINTEARQWLAGEWLDGAALAPLAELNSQCLELISAMAMAEQGNLLQQALGRQIAGLTREARANDRSALQRASLRGIQLLGASALERRGN